MSVARTTPQLYDEARPMRAWMECIILRCIPAKVGGWLACRSIRTVLMLLVIVAVLPLLVVILHAHKGLFWNLGALVLAVLLGFAAAGYIGTIAIIWPARKLAQAAHKLGLGDFEACVGTVGGTRELQHLARTLDEMAGLMSSRIAKQCEVEQALRHSEERYRRIFNGISDAAFVHEILEDGVLGKFIEANDVACHRLGYTREELLDRRPTDIDARETQAGVPTRIKQVLAEGSAIWEGVHVTKDSRRIPVEISSSLFELDGKKMVFSAVRDISERARSLAERNSLEEQLRQSQKMEAVGRLAGGVAHDFNNLLMAILGYSEMLLNDPKVPPAMRDELQEIQRAGERAAGLTRQLLAFSRKQVIEPVSLNLGNVMRESEKMIRRIIGEDIRFTCHVEAKCGRIKADPGQIEQILMNLVVNSRDAMPKGGVLTMETREVLIEEEYARTNSEARAGRWALLAISDNGIGMSKETLSHLFEPFYTTKPKGKGTGLGLATVYGIVKQNKGFILVYSELAMGTSIKIYFPVIESDVSSLDTREHPSAVPHGTETILLVEDELLVRQLTRTMLTRLGYQVIEAASGNEALEKYREDINRIDLLITDVVMPGMNGRELQEAMRRLRPGLKTLFVSGYTDDVIANHGILEAGVHFVAKPFSSGKLASKIREVIEG